MTINFATESNKGKSLYSFPISKGPGTLHFRGYRHARIRPKSSWDCVDSELGLSCQAGRQDTAVSHSRKQDSHCAQNSADDCQGCNPIGRHRIEPTVSRKRSLKKTKQRFPESSHDKRFALSATVLPATRSAALPTMHEKAIVITVMICARNGRLAEAACLLHSTRDWP